MCVCVCVCGRGVNKSFFANFIKEILYTTSSLYVKVGKPLKMKKKKSMIQKEKENLQGKKFE